MRVKYILLLTIIVLVAYGCSGSISGTVVDADTGQAIEGAVVLVEWTKTSGKWIGLRSTKSHKVIETVTDKDGKFSMWGVISPFADPPHQTIYKKGYVAWNNEFIFPDYVKRGNNNLSYAAHPVIQMKQFDVKKYTHTDHVLFIEGCINSGLPGSNKKLMEEAIRWEELKAQEERQKNK